MSEVLILFAHPVPEKSRVNSQLTQGLDRIKGVTFRDLYDLYPDFDIDITKEQQLLTRHDYIILQHPFYWYSAPPLVKQWIDLVLEHGWAYGSKGKALEGKKFFNSITTGGPREVYNHEGRNRFTIREFLAPFEQTALLCNMTYLPPFVTHGSHRATPEEIVQQGVKYRRLLEMLVNDELNIEDMTKAEYMNELVNNINN